MDITYGIDALPENDPYTQVADRAFDAGAIRNRSELVSSQYLPCDDALARVDARCICRSLPPWNMLNFVCAYRRRIQKVRSEIEAGDRGGGERALSGDVATHGTPGFHSAMDLDSRFAPGVWLYAKLLRVAFATESTRER